MSVIDLLDAEIAELEKQIERRRAARALLLDEAPPAAPTPKPREPKAAKKPVAKPNAAKPPAVEGEKYCRACDQSKPVAEFAVNNSKSDGRQSRCRECMGSYYAARRSRDAAAKTKPEEPTKPAGWVDPAERLKLIRERAARGAS